MYGMFCVSQIAVRWNSSEHYIAAQGSGVHSPVSHEDCVKMSRTVLSLATSIQDKYLVDFFFKCSYFTSLREQDKTYINSSWWLTPI